MQRTYEYKNATIYVSSQDEFDREYLKKVTKDFLIRVIEERRKNGNSNTSKNFREK